MSRGRHQADRGDFGRDLIITIVGIAVVAVVVFGGLWAFSTWRDGDTTPTTVATTIPSDEGSQVLPGGSTTTTAAPDTTTTTGPPETTNATIAVRDPSEITVQVLNAVGTTGLAGEVTEALQTAGYQTVEADDYEPLQDRSQVLFRDGYGPEAFEVAAAFFPDAQVGMSPDLPDDVDIMVLLGSSYEAE